MSYNIADRHVFDFPSELKDPYWELNVAVCYINGISLYESFWDSERSEEAFRYNPRDMKNSRTYKLA